MAKRNQKKALDYKQFRQWKKDQKKNRELYKRSEVFHRNIFEDFKEKVITGEASSLDFIEDPAMKLSTLKMVLDEMDDTLQIMQRIPTLRFRPEWDVQVLPNFMGTFARFRINGKLSVYLDYYNRLGIMGGAPYWEVYNDDYPVRFAMNDAVAMMDYIADVFESEEKSLVANKQD